MLLQIPPCGLMKAKLGRADVPPSWSSGNVAVVAGGAVVLVDPGSFGVPSEVLTLTEVFRF